MGEKVHLKVVLEARVWTLRHHAGTLLSALMRALKQELVHAAPRRLVCSKLTCSSLYETTGVKHQMVSVGSSVSVCVSVASMCD